MLRVKLPAGQLTPAKLRAIGEVSKTYGRCDGELATRQNIQLHWLELAALPEVFAHLDKAGITTAGGCGGVGRRRRAGHRRGSRWALLRLPGRGVPRWSWLCDVERTAPRGASACCCRSRLVWWRRYVAPRE